MRIVLASKLYNVKVEDKVLACDGSIGIPKRLMEAAGIREYEQVHVLGVSNDNRPITFAIPANYLTLYGGISRMFEIDDEIVILTYRIVDEDKPIPLPIIVDARVEYEKPKPMSEYLERTSTFRKAGEIICK